MGLFKRNKKADDEASAAPAVPVARQYHHIDSQEKKAAAVASGELVEIMLLPTAFGGDARPENVVAVPPGIDQAKATVDGTILRFAQEGLINNFKCDVKYDDGGGFVPRRLEIKCTNSDPSKTGSFNPTIEVL